MMFRQLSFRKSAKRLGERPDSKGMINSGIEPLTLRCTIQVDIRRMLYRLS